MLKYMYITLSQHHQRRTEPQPVNIQKDLVKDGHAVFHTNDWTDRQTDRHSSQYFTPLPGAK